MTPQLRSNEQRNRILNALSSSDLALLQPYLDPVPLRFRDLTAVRQPRGEARLLP
jgi:hypothetical protein